MSPQDKIAPSNMDQLTMWGQIMPGLAAAAAAAAAVDA
jgi:hypothetical protein